MKYIKYVPYAIVSVLLIVGGLTWFTVLTSLQERNSEPALTVKPPVVEEVLIPEDELREERLRVNFNVDRGLTEEMVKDWNIEKDGVSIDRLLTLIEEQDE